MHSVSDKVEKIDCIVVMGVSGSGKTTLGQGLSKKLSWPFFDADDFHPESNHKKLAAGIPLTDDDRAPWLQTLAELIRSHSEKGQSIVLACSALKGKYRNILRDGLKVEFAYLKGSKELIAERLKTRKGHFMNPDLLDSQFATLEEPHSALVLDIASTPDTLVKTVLENFGLVN